jgi:hypothetical protein
MHVEINFLVNIALRMGMILHSLMKLRVFAIALLLGSVLFHLLVSHLDPQNSNRSTYSQGTSTSTSNVTCVKPGPSHGKV